ncbi:unnamed protein product [Rangifer tarandus platyrhynchus]|uniref:Uncharacterized protein n=1 Tax=Rangifer tarandus platyrhynchus TaxID=3082113 RepID=A0AC60A2L6_RANTA
MCGQTGCTSIIWELVETPQAQTQARLVLRSPRCLPLLGKEAASRSDIPGGVTAGDGGGGRLPLEVSFSRLCSCSRAPATREGPAQGSETNQPPSMNATSRTPGLPDLTASQSSLR